MITCRDCNTDPVEDEHKGDTVLACTGCGNILFRAIRREAAEQLGGIRP